MSSKSFRLVDTLRTVPESNEKVSRSAAERPCTEGRSQGRLQEQSPKQSQDRMPEMPQKCDIPEIDAPAADAEITDITPLDGGEWVSVTVKIGNDTQNIRLSAEQYGALRPRVGTVPTEMSEALREAGRLCDAVRKGMELLGYGAVSRRRLIQKLIRRGFDRETAVSAADYLSDRGCLSETADACRFAEQGVRKLWGVRRIREDLYARGFPADAVSEAIEALEDVDFVGNCRRVIEKKYGGVPKERDAIKKMIAALVRLGYTSEQIREAMRQ